MELSHILQITIAASVLFVWTFRFENIVKEFQVFGFSSSFRTLIGTIKIILSTLLIVGIWHQNLVLIPTILMAFLMICAQYTHFRVKNPLPKFIPSFVLLVLCLILASRHLQNWA